MKTLFTLLLLINVLNISSQVTQDALPIPIHSTADIQKRDSMLLFFKNPLIFKYLENYSDFEYTRDSNNNCINKIDIISTLFKSSESSYFKEDFKNAKYFCEKIISYDSSNCNAIRLLIPLYFKEKDMKSFERYSRLLYIIKPSNENKLLLTYALSYIGRYDESLIYLKQLDSLNYEQGLIYLRMAHNYQKLKQLDKSFEFAMLSLKLFNDNSTLDKLMKGKLYLLIGRIYLAKNDKIKAKEYFVLAQENYSSPFYDELQQVNLK